MSYPEDDIFAGELEQDKDDNSPELSGFERGQELAWLDFDEPGDSPDVADVGYEKGKEEMEGPYWSDFFAEEAEFRIDDPEPDDGFEGFAPSYEEDEGYEETIDDEEDFAQIDEGLEENDHFEEEEFDAGDPPINEDEQFSSMFPFTQAEFRENLFRHLIESERPTHLSDVNEIAAFAWGPTLRRGSRGSAVRTLQKLLSIAGANLSVDGIFGPATQRAVRNFQSSEGLQVDGIVGPKTKAALTRGRAAQGPAAPPPVTNRPGTGSRPSGGTASSGLHARIVEVAKRMEWRRWRPGGGTPMREDEAAAIPIVKEYWRVGVRRNMPTNKINNADRRKRVAWSAAFISYCMREAGAGNTFRYSGGHWVYVGEAKRNRIRGLRDKPFWAYRPHEAPLMLGDLICNWREQEGRNFTPSYDNMDQKRNWFSHCDIVVAINGSTAKVLGGNKRDSVRIVDRRLNPDGTLNTSGDQRKFIAVVRYLGDQDSIDAPDPSGSVRDIQTDESSSLGRVPLFFGGREVRRYQFTEEDKLWAGRLIEGEDAKPGKGQDAVIQAMINRFATIAMKSETRMRYSTFANFLRAYSSPLFRPSKRTPSAKHARLQRKPFHELIPEAQRLAVAYLSGARQYTDFGNATDFGSVRIWFYRRNGRYPTRSEFESYARAHARRRKYARWVGPIDGLDQYRRNTFFVTKTADSLPIGAIKVA